MREAPYQLKGTLRGHEGPLGAFLTPGLEGDMAGGASRKESEPPPQGWQRQLIISTQKYPTCCVILDSGQETCSSGRG